MTTPPLRLTVAGALAGIVRPVALLFDEVRVVRAHARLDETLRQAAETAPNALVDVIAGVRAMYRRVGLDPTKIRPSSEALLRRVRRGESLPRINNVVDVGNWCSLEFQLPYGLYDADSLDGDVELRLGHPDERYEGIRKDEVHVAGRLVVADVHGAFGNPTSDSARTAVDTSTTRVLVVIHAPVDVDPAHVERAVDRTAARLAEFAGARLRARLGPIRA
jgi:DNA/RNA-binding domain of Phe-tRNA-synthetase-like protein